MPEDKLYKIGVGFSPTIVSESRLISQFLGLKTKAIGYASLKFRLRKLRNPILQTANVGKYQTNIALTGTGTSSR